MVTLDILQGDKRHMLWHWNGVGWALQLSLMVELQARSAGRLATCCIWISVLLHIFQQKSHRPMVGSPV